MVLHWKVAFTMLLAHEQEPHQMLEMIGKSKAGAVLAKSATLLKQTGNDMPRYKEIDVGGGCIMSINSEGLPNKGIDYYLADEAVASGVDNSKPYIVSLSAKKHR